MLTGKKDMTVNFVFKIFQQFINLGEISNKSLKIDKYYDLGS